MSLLSKGRGPLCLILFIAASARADGTSTQGTTSLRLDAVDTTASRTEEFVLYASFLDKYLKPVVVTDASKWALTVDGEPAEALFTVQRLMDSERGVSVAVVAGAYEAFRDEAFQHIQLGLSRLLNSLRAIDQSAIVVYGKSVDSTSGLNPSHNEAVNWLGEQKVGGATPLLFESIEKALRFFPSDYSSVGPNRAVVVVSDGWDKDMYDVAKTKDLVQTVQRTAKKRGVRISVIGVAIDEDANSSETLQRLKDIAGYTGGTYRIAATPQDIEVLLGHQQDEFAGQHIFMAKAMSLNGPKESGFKLEVDQDGKRYASNLVMAYVDEPESHFGRYALLVLGGLTAIALLFFLVRVLLRSLRRRPDEVFDSSGPEMTECSQCGNTIPPEWHVCRYCEALPHHGRLTVQSIGELNGHVFFIVERLTNIGSAESNTVLIADKSVSKRHAGIKVEDGRFELADFGSTNGVLVNGVRVTKQFLKDGDIVTVGAVELQFSLK